MRNEASSLPGPVFLGGEGRSGTTLLSVILNNHPDLTMGPELHFRGPRDLGPLVLQAIDLIRTSAPTEVNLRSREDPTLRGGIMFVRRAQRFGIHLDDLQGLVTSSMSETGTPLEEFPDRARLISALGERRQHDSDSLMWGCKIMRDICGAQRYLEAWPNSLFIHLVRDGRDVAASQMRDHASWGYPTIEKAAQSWRRSVMHVPKIIPAARLHTLRYEDLTRDPETELKALMGFLSLPWNDILLTHHERAESAESLQFNHPSKEQVLRPINSSAIQRFETDLTGEEIAIFESLAGDALLVQGYKLSSRSSA